MARADRVKADPLGSPRSGLALTRSSTPSGCCGRAQVGGYFSFAWRSKVRAGFGNLVCVPDQTHIRSSREANGTNIPLAAGRLERTRPLFVAAFEAMQSIGSSTRIGRG
jgi:hypothetical protein